MGIVRHGEQPNPDIPADWKDKVLHARIELGSTLLMGADIPHAERMRSAYLTLSLDTEGDAERTYELLPEGGEIFMPLAKTPFANRFGTSWMLLHHLSRRDDRFAGGDDRDMSGEVRGRRTVSASSATE